MNRSFRWLLAIAGSVLPASLAAQATPPPAGVAIPVAKNQVLSVQPINVVLTVYTAEYERRILPSATLGVGGTYWNQDDDDDGDISYTSGDVKLRYYPNGRVFQGFSFGGQVGFTRISEDEVSCEGCSATSNSASGPSFGFALDYGWLLGATRSFYVGLGVGAKAVFIDDEEFSDDVTLRYPTARVSVGYAF